MGEETMRKETEPPKICVHCKRPITGTERPAVLFANGNEVHVECWNDYKAHEESSRKRPN